MSELSFWHDHETFGGVSRRDRPAQFGGLPSDDLQTGVASSHPILYA
jgi:exonuclease I